MKYPYQIKLAITEDLYRKVKEFMLFAKEGTGNLNPQFDPEDYLVMNILACIDRKDTMIFLGSYEEDYKDQEIPD